MLLKQILLKLPSDLTRKILQLHQKHYRDSDGVPSNQVLMDILLSIPLQVPKAYIVCDALDEVELSRLRNVLFPFLRQLAEGGYRLFLTSRPEITAILSDYSEPFDTIDPNWPPNLQLQGLDFDYRRMLDEIQGMPLQEKRYAFRVISWVYNAACALTIKELEDALLTDAHLPNDRNSHHLASNLAHQCKGFIVVDEETGHVDRLHNSVKDFLEKGHVLVKEDVGAAYRPRVCLRVSKRARFRWQFHHRKAIRTTASSIVFLCSRLRIIRRSTSNIMFERCLRKIPWMTFSVLSNPRQADSRTQSFIR